MPAFLDSSGDNIDYSSKSDLQATEVTQKDQDFVTAYSLGADRNALSTTLSFGVGATFDLADSVASSLIPGVERQDLNNTFLSAIGSPGLMKWHKENQGSLELGSGVVGAIASYWAAGKVLASGGKAMQVLRGKPFVGKIAQLDRTYERSLRIAEGTMAMAARQGAMGVDRLVAEQVTLARFGAPGLSLTTGQAAKGVLRAGFNRELARNVTTEGIMAATLHTNSMLYDDSMAHNLAWSAGGLAVGAGFARLADTYALRRIANSDKIRAINRAAYDPSGLEAKRVGALGVVSSILSSAKGSPLTDDLLWARGNMGQVTDNITSMAIQAGELSKQAPLGAKDGTKTLFGRREELATPMWSMAGEEINKATTKGVRGVPGSQFATTTEGLGRPLNQSIYHEPTSLYGLNEIGRVPDGMTIQEAVDMRQSKLDSAFQTLGQMAQDGGKWTRRKVKDKATGKLVQMDELVPMDAKDLEAVKGELLDLHHARSMTPVVMLEPGEWSPASWGKIAEQYTPLPVKREGSLGRDDLKVWRVEGMGKDKSTLAISSNGDIILPKFARGKVESLDAPDSLQFYQLARRAVKDMAKEGATLRLPKNPSWAQLDMAEQLAIATGDASRVVYPAGMTRESALVESFAQKVDILKKEEAVRNSNARRGLGGPAQIEDAYAAKIKLNLPRLTPHQFGMMNAGDHPIDVLLHGLESGAQVRAMTHQDVLKAVNDARAIVGFTEDVKPGLGGLSGKSYNFLMDSNGDAMKPILGMRRPMRPGEWTRDELFTRQTLHEVRLKQALTGEQAHPANRMVTEALISHPAFAASRNVAELADDQSRSFIPGFTHAAPQTSEGAFVNALTSRGRRDVDNLNMQGASQIQEIKTRMMQAVAKETFTTHLGDLPTRLGSNRNAKSKMLNDQFISFRGGWQLLPEPRMTTLPDGSTAYEFLLDHSSALNQKRFEQMFGEPLDKGQPLLNPNGKAIVLDELSFEYRVKMQEVFKQELAMKNDLLTAMGLPTVKETPWYVKPANDKNKYVEYVFDAKNDVVPGMKISAENPRQLAELRKQVKDSDQWRDGYAFRSRDRTESFMTLWDEAQMDFMAPDTTAIMPGKQNFGNSGSNLHNAKGMEEELASTLASILRHGDDLIETIYESPIKAARARAAIAKEATTGRGTSAVEHSSVYDRYLQNLTGRSSLTAKDSFFGNPMAWAEQRINGFLQSDSVTQSLKAKEVMFDYLRAANPFDRKQLPAERFAEFSKALGPHMPFKSVSQMVERETGSKMPPELAKISNQLSWFEASSRLRWFESMHAMANFGSMVGNMPSVIRALQPMKGETAAEAAMRNSNLTMMLNVPGKGDVVLPNSARLLWDSMRDAQKSLPDEFTTKAIARGFMGQEVAELNRGFDAIKSRTGFDKFFFGDPNAKTALGKKGLDGAMDIMSSRSEDFTRAWGMYAGRRVAESMGIRNVDDQLNFSHGLVNDLIANYDPRNRPEIFQGALGAPLGLFTSYSINFYQRMFRYIETGNARALANQAAMQSAVFGTSSLPGWDQLNWAFFDRGQGKTGPDGELQDPIASLEKRLGKDASDLFMHGLISNLPKIFGADGVALYTRGDAQFRSPVNPLNMIQGDSMFSMPVIDTFSRIFSGIGQSMAQFSAMGTDIGLNQIAEIASNVITNRPLAGFVEMVGAGGYDTDASGQVVAKSELLSADGIYRMLGTRSMTQQKVNEKFYQSRAAQEEQGARQDVLNIATRQAIRDERFDAIPGLFAKYVEQGGKAQYYSKWVKSAFDSGLNTRGDRLLKKALNDQNNQSNAYIARMLDAGIETVDDEANTDDYGRDAQIDQIVQAGWETTPVVNPMEDRVNDSSLGFNDW